MPPPRFPGRNRQPPYEVEEWFQRPDSTPRLSEEGMVALVQATALGSAVVVGRFHEVGVYL